MNPRAVAHLPLKLDSLQSRTFRTCRQRKELVSLDLIKSMGIGAHLEVGVEAKGQIELFDPLVEHLDLQVEAVLLQGDCVQKVKLEVPRGPAGVGIFQQESGLKGRPSIRNGFRSLVG